MPRLDLYADYKLFVKIKLGQGSVLIGRGSDCDIQLPDERVSRHHAQIDPHSAGSYRINDLSVNGTRLNHAMLTEPTRLNPGDRIYIEDHVIIYQPDDVPPEELDQEWTKLS